MTLDGSARFNMLRDRHAGERAVIVANGPSLNRMDLSPLRREITIGLNKIYLGFKRFGFYPRYYVAVNPKVIEQSVQEIQAMNCIKFIGNRSGDIIPEDALTYRINTIKPPERFITDIGRGVHEGWTVTHAALQIAYFLGFSEVILIGLDHRYHYTGKPNEAHKLDGPDLNHFCEDYFGFGQTWDNPDLTRSEESFRIARAEYEKDGRRIIDATLNGACTIFEKADYRQIFALKSATAEHIPIRMLGQSGCRLSFPGATVYVDPYLSNSVQELEAPDLDRLIPIPFPPTAATDADWVLITHDHIDHCDPRTLPLIAESSRDCLFMGPSGVLRKLTEWGIPYERMMTATTQWQSLGGNLRVCAIPALHPTIERNAHGLPTCVGYMLDHAGFRIYVAGDTSAGEELIEALKPFRPIHTAFLPVNEHNFFRARRGIIGNMSVREAFLLAEEIGVEQVVAVHWDMFAVNSVCLEEIQAIYERMRPRFRLLINPTHIEP